MKITVVKTALICAFLFSPSAQSAELKTGMSLGEYRSVCKRLSWNTPGHRKMKVERSRLVADKPHGSKSLWATPGRRKMNVASAKSGDESISRPSYTCPRTREIHRFEDGKLVG
jgi:hypothetical protein